MHITFEIDGNDGFNNILDNFDGIHIIVHKTNELPIYTGDHFYFPYGRASYLTISPELILIDDYLKSSAVEVRHCFLSHENKLKYFKIYTKKNCEQECLSLMMAKTCDCVPYYLISKKQLKNHIYN